MKRTLSILLAVLLLVSCTVVASAYSVFEEGVLTVDEAIANYEASSGETVETNRYYFLMPDGTNGQLGDDETSALYGKFATSWYDLTVPADATAPSAGQTFNATTTAGIYWWGSGIADPESWAGYRPSGKDADDENVYYADLPVENLAMIIWNNGVDGGQDTTQDIYYCAAQTSNIPAEFYLPGDSDLYPEGLENFDEMIFVIDPDLVAINDYSGKQTCGGEWYYYYGKGCYGTVKGGTEEDCIRDDHNHDYIVGDTDLDGFVTIVDATEIQRHAAQLKILDDVALKAADADVDGIVTVMDATEIQRFVAQLIPSLPRP